MTNDATAKKPPAHDEFRIQIDRIHYVVTKPVMTGQQWVKGTKWPYESVVVANGFAPMVPAVELQPMKY